MHGSVTDELDQDSSQEDPLCAGSLDLDANQVTNVETFSEGVPVAELLFLRSGYKLREECEKILEMNSVSNGSR